MFDSLSIANFRAFKELEISPLRRVNLIIGGNNVGKTSVLEAVWFALQREPLPLIAPSLFRRSAIDYSTHTQAPKDDIDNFWKWLFFQKDMSQPISINLRKTNTSDVAQTWTLSSNGTSFKSTSNNGACEFSTRQTSETLSPQLSEPPPQLCTTLAAILPSPVVDAELVNSVSVLDRDDELTEYLRKIDPRIRKQKYLKLPGHQHNCVYVDVFGKGKELIPSTQLGQGFGRMLNLFASLITNEKAKVLLIDEFENGLQHDALVPVWSALGEFARAKDIQIFATTHSYECITAAHEAFSTTADDLTLIKLRRERDNSIAAFSLDYDHVSTVLKTEMEIR